MYKLKKNQNLQEKRHNRVLKNLFIFLLISSAFSPLSARAANHYIRAGATGDGSDWTHALGQLPENLIRGDTYYIADGNYPSYTFDDPEDGNLYITIKKATIEDHGTDTGWQDSYGDGQAIFTTSALTTLLFTSSYWIFDGQTGGGPAGWDKNHGFKITSTNINSNAILVSLGQHWIDNQPDFVEIHHTQFEFPPESYPSVNYGIYAMVSGDQLGEGNGPQHILINSCYFYHVQKPIKTRHCRYWTLENTYIHRNWCDPPESNQGAGWEDFGSDYCIVRYCLFKDISGTANLDFKTNFCDEFNDWLIYGNVFCVTLGNPYKVATGPGVIVVTGNCLEQPSLARNFKIYNNSFINIQSEFSGAGICIHSGENGNNIVENNLWYHCAMPAQFSNVENNYNTLINTEYAWNATPGSEDIYIAQDLDPFENWQENNFNIKEELTDRIGQGNPLSSPYNMDMFGNIRGDDGVWDRGAIEYVSSETTDQKPTASITSPTEGDDFSYENRTITFDGSDSYDPDGTIVQWTWTDNLGSTIPDGESVTAALSSGTHTITLTVTDNSGLTDTDTVTITVLEEEENSPTSDSPLSAHWKLTENSGTRALDSAGSGHHGTCIDEPVWTAGQGLQLAGTQYIEVADADAFELTASKTFSAWVKLDAYTNWAKILIKPHTAFDAPWEMYTLDLGSRGSSPRFVVTDGIAGGTAATAANSAYTLDLNQWYHLAGTYDGSRITLYLNGSEIASADADFAIGTNAMPLCIGGRLGQNTVHGCISDVRIYSEALTAEQVQTLYTNGRNDGLTGYWKMDDFSPEIAADASGYQHTATLVGQPGWGRRYANNEDFIHLTSKSQALEVPSTAIAPEAGTVALWACPADEIGAHYLFGHVNNGSSRIALLTLNGQLALSMGSAALAQQEISLLPANQFAHVALTWENGQYAVYVNSEQLAVGTYTDLTSLYPTFDIGNYGDPALRVLGFEGLIDEVRTYNRALTADEIMTLYQTYQHIENKSFALLIEGTDQAGSTVSYTTTSLPNRAQFDTASQYFQWRPWYNQSGRYSIIFSADDLPDQKIILDVDEIIIEDWYRAFLENCGKL